MLIYPHRTALGPAPCLPLGKSRFIRDNGRFGVDEERATMATQIETGSEITDLISREGVHRNLCEG
ncbi:MAG TPA: hypothetical protein VKB56_01540, partial [Terriglobales bacterium]|nr:hypothetical protein [Terriglobales bacterium]